jgi:hypothetical protein
MDDEWPGQEPLGMVLIEYIGCLIFRRDSVSGSRQAIHAAALHTTLGAAVALAFLGLTSLSASAQNAEGLKLPADRSAEPAASSRAPVSGTCTTARARFKTDTNLVATSSTGESLVPGASLTFTKSSGAGCVIVRFSAESFAPRNTTIRIRPLIDGTASAQPGPQPVIWNADHDEDNNGNGLRVHSFEWVFPSVAVGSHTVTLRWSSNNGATVNFFFRTLTILHE